MLFSLAYDALYLCRSSDVRALGNTFQMHCERSGE